MYLKLASKIWCHLVSNLQRYDTISAHVPNLYGNLLQKNFSTQEWLLNNVCNSRHIVSVSLCSKKLKYRQIKKFLAVSLSDVVLTMLINVKMPKIVGTLTFMSRINFVLS